jgi:hypothetical protein
MAGPKTYYIAKYCVLYLIDDSARRAGKEHKITGATNDRDAYRLARKYAKEVLEKDDGSPVSITANLECVLRMDERETYRAPKRYAIKP